MGEQGKRLPEIIWDIKMPNLTGIFQNRSDYGYMYINTEYNVIKSALARFNNLSM